MHLSVLSILCKINIVQAKRQMAESNPMTETSFYYCLINRFIYQTDSPKNLIDSFFLNTTTELRVLIWQISSTMNL